MFAPEGYRPLDEVLFDLEDMTSPYLQSREAEFFEHAQRFKNPQLLVRLWRASMNMAAAIMFVDGRYEVNEPIRICSPEGRILVPGFEFFISNFHGRDQIEVPDFQSSIDEMHQFTVNEGRLRYYAMIDQRNWMVDIPDYRGFKDEELVVRGNKIKEISTYFRPFDGWSLCVEENFSLTNVLPLLGVEAASKGTIGRPPLVPRVKLAVRKLYPLGKSASWKAMARAVSIEIGEAVHERTVQRAVRQMADEVRQNEYQEATELTTKPE